MRLFITLLFTLSLVTFSGHSIAGTNNPAVSQQHIVDLLSHYGMTHITELTWNDQRELEVSGYDVDDFQVEVSFTADGRILREQRERVGQQPWGLSLQQLSRTLKKGIAEGMQQFATLTIVERGKVALKGACNNGDTLDLQYAHSDF